MVIAMSETARGSISVSSNKVTISKLPRLMKLEERHQIQYSTKKKKKSR